MINKEILDKEVVKTKVDKYMCNKIGRCVCNKSDNGCSNRNRTKGITLVALVVTIILLLILAGISIQVLTGKQRILVQAGKAKEQTEIATEKEQIQLAMTNMNFENETSLLTRKSLFQGYLNNLVGENGAKAYVNGNGYTVQFLSSNRIYTIEESGNIIQEDVNILKADNTPGAFDGSGTQDDPYMIMSIEDLVYFSKTVGNGTTYAGNYIKMGRTLDFNSELSYVNYETKDYNEFLEVTDDIGLLEVLTSRENKGFKPISGEFNGYFDGNNNILKNLYINREGDAGLFGSITFNSTATIENLEVTGEIICNGNNAGAIIAELNWR